MSSRSEEKEQGEQVEAVDINGSYLSYNFVWYHASSTLKWKP